LAPLDFEIISKKRLFFQFRGVKTTFHRFCPPPGKKFWENTLLAPLVENILPTPMPLGQTSNMRAVNKTWSSATFNQIASPPTLEMLTWHRRKQELE